MPIHPLTTIRIIAASVLIAEGFYGVRYLLRNAQRLASIIREQPKVEAFITRWININRPSLQDETLEARYARIAQEKWNREMAAQEKQSREEAEKERQRLLPILALSRGTLEKRALPVSLAALPKDKRTIFLRLADWKARVCRPYAH